MCADRDRSTTDCEHVDALVCHSHVCATQLALIRLHTSFTSNSVYPLREQSATCMSTPCQWSTYLDSRVRALPVPAVAARGKRPATAIPLIIFISVFVERKKSFPLGSFTANCAMSNTKMELPTFYSCVSTRIPPCHAAVVAFNSNAIVWPPLLLYILPCTECVQTFCPALH